MTYIEECNIFSSHVFEFEYWQEVQIYTQNMGWHASCSFCFMRIQNLENVFLIWGSTDHFLSLFHDFFVLIGVYSFI